MNRGPQRGIRADDDATFVDKAHTAWGEVPRWVLMLAERADTAGLKVTGKQIGYSTSAVSATISRKYTGDLPRVREAVEGALMGRLVMCPVLGEIGRDRCLTEQKKPCRPTNSTSIRLYAACRNGCVNYRGGRS